MSESEKNLFETENYQQYSVWAITMDFVYFNVKL